MRSDCGFSYNVTEFTSSGLTHTVATQLGRLAEPFCNTLFRSRYNVGPFVLDRSFGDVSIDWVTREIHLRVVTATGSRPHNETIRLDDLQPNTSKNIHWDCVERFSSPLYTLQGGEFMLMFGAVTGMALLFGAALGAYMWTQCRRKKKKQTEKRKKAH